MGQWRKCYSFMGGWRWNAGSGNRGDQSTPDTEQPCRMMCRYSRLQTVCFTKVHTGWKVEFRFVSMNAWVILNFYGKWHCRASRNCDDLVKKKKKKGCTFIPSLAKHAHLNVRYIKSGVICIYNSTQSTLCVFSLGELLIKNQIKYF